MKISPVGAELFHADGQTDRRIVRSDEANSRFYKFCECTLKSIQMNKLSFTSML